MRARTRILPRALVAAALLLAACGDEADPAGPATARPGPHWPAHAEESRPVRIVVPDARHGLPDSNGGSLRLILNVLPDGAVVLKGNRWHVASVDATERQAYLAGLRAQLVELTTGARERGHASPLPVQLVADREAPWTAIRQILSMLREGAIGTQQLQWAVRVPTRAGDRSDHRVDGMLQEVVESTPPVLRIVADRGESWTVVRIFSPAGIHSFGPQATRIAEEAFLRKANATWIDLERTLPALAEEHSTAHVEVRDAEADVWFAYVVKTVDLLFGAGFEQVRLPQEGIVLMRPGDDG